MRARWLTRIGRSAGAVTVALGLFATAACSSDSDKNTDDKGGEKKPAASGAAFPRTVDHAMGETDIEEAPKRIVALDMTFVDAAFALEGNVVGYTTFTGPDEKLPPYFGEDGEKYGAEAVEVGTLDEPSTEKILALKPDLILSAKVRHEKLYKDLSGIAPTVFTETTGATWKDNLRLVGEALGKEDLAEQKITAFEKRAKTVGDSVRQQEGGNPTVSVVRFVDGPTRLYKEDTYVGVILNDLGFGFPKDAQGTGFNADISEEQIAKVDADDIFVTAYPDPSGTGEKNKQKFMANPLWKQLEGDVHEVSDITWMIAVGLYGAESVLDDVADTYGVDAARA
ncbi:MULTISPECIES: ABC transporter substrate-binding protein [unclassified Streptomyces]|uniref:ABC transporter substrate-binding protein n=1 Tax=unclassified Streptomyces TaxID=2593676 RepID=UPI0022B6DFA1|nr:MULTISPECIES: iron-siderophore ABC transporter substrate-binding protein [unclassified Streptomyces]MCZ7413690.1 iron-siderophore ABC transporter substrate-binding protein [Streptomyces sp. WMMC897]MCZ7430686.1 iron-siderophore ABC transporter substrate-binding protein [Streptomyces sp. WMMC1477]